MHNKTKTNTELTQTMSSTLNNRSTTAELQPLNGQQPKKPGGGAKFELSGMNKNHPFNSSCVIEKYYRWFFTFELPQKGIMISLNSV